MQRSTPPIDAGHDPAGPCPEISAATDDAIGRPNDAHSTGVQERLVAGLCRDLERVATAPVQVLQTHISYVVLTGRHAYKIKKAVDLGFLDFSTLEARRFYCEQEVRLNRRLAPALYVGVVPITGSIDAPHIGGQGAVLEYAVEMVEFAQEALLCNVLERGELAPEHIDALAATIADFHGRIDAATPESRYGTPDAILESALENFTELRPLLDRDDERRRVDALERWTRGEHRTQRPTFEQRRRAGRVRECHGDLHLGNIVLLDGRVVPFDCIEFSDGLRWIDVLSEIAFTCMDLEDRGQRGLAQRFLNAYLEITGDYAGLRVLRFYVVYRAMVRAKVAAMRASQLPEGPARAILRDECSDYLGLALRFTLAVRGGAVITHGFSGSGKTTLSQSLLEHIGAVRIRSDVERKRMHGLAARERSASQVGGGLYTPDSTLATYGALHDLAASVIGSGYVVIVDATFLKRWQREWFRELAHRHGVPFVVASFEAGADELGRRIAKRGGSDASEADRDVLGHQLATAEPLTREEMRRGVVFDTRLLLTPGQLRAAWNTLTRLLQEQVPGHAPDRCAPGPALEDKLAFLARPESYAAGTTSVVTVETHLSWVFLTDREAYKLKKPVRTAFVDLGTLVARGQNCSDEVALNRRLTDGVYVGVVALTRNGMDVFSLGGPGQVVDWLVHMRRLPADRMLDRLVCSGTMDPADLAPAIDRLCGFYAQADVLHCTGVAYRARFAQGIADARRELARFPAQLPPSLIERIATRQLAALEQAGLFDARARDGRIVEGHGDLRPEHICLTAPPQIIDCLEFSRELRTLDSADELAFLALECERLGAPGLKRVIFDRYALRSGDAPPARLVHFYQSYRAMVRARLAIAHLDDAPGRDPLRWSAQARTYLDLALAHVDAAR